MNYNPINETTVMFFLYRDGEYIPIKEEQTKGYRFSTARFIGPEEWRIYVER